MAHKSYESDTGRFKRGPKSHAGRDAVAAPGTCAIGRLADGASEAADCIVVLVVPGSQLDGGRDDLWTRIDAISVSVTVWARKLDAEAGVCALHSPHQGR